MPSTFTGVRGILSRAGSLFQDNSELVIARLQYGFPHGNIFLAGFQNARKSFKYSADYLVRGLIRPTPDPPPQGGIMRFVTVSIAVTLR